MPGAALAQVHDDCLEVVEPVGQQTGIGRLAAAAAAARAVAARGGARVGGVRCIVVVAVTMEVELEWKVDERAQFGLTVAGVELTREVEHECRRRASDTHALDGTVTTAARARVIRQSL